MAILKKDDRIELNTYILITTCVVMLNLLLVYIFFKITNKLLSASLYKISTDYLYPADVLPEPDERYTFYFFILLFVPLIIGTLVFFNKYVFKKIKPRLLQLNPNLLLTGIVGFLFYITFFTHNFINKYNFRWIEVCVAVSVALIAAYLLLRFVKEKIIIRIFEVCCFFLLLFASCRYIVTQNALFMTDDIFFFNLQFVMDPIISLLSSPNGEMVYTQYGCYAIFLTPLIELFHDKIFVATIVFTLLIICVHICLYFTIFKVTSNKMISILSALTILFTAGNFSLEKWLTMPYFQYYPIRVIFPAIILLLFILLNGKNRFQRCLSYIIPILCGLAIIWNLDTGICITITYYFVRIMQEIENSFNSNNTFKLKHVANRFVKKILLEFIITVIVVFLIFSTCLNPADISNLFQAQRLYYIEGYFMLPMPHTLNLWMLVLSLYIAGGVYYFMNFAKNKYDKYPILFIAIFGIGIFSYYQGRSHTLVLPTCIYPAILLFFIFLNKIVNRFFVNQTEKSMALFIFYVYIFLISSFISLVSFNGFSYIQKYHWLKKIDSKLKIQSDFIKKTSVGKNQIAIISDDSTYLYCLTEKKRVPCVKRILTIIKKSQLNLILHNIEEKNLPFIYVSTQTFSSGYKYIFPQINKLIVKKYITVAKDKNGHMLLLKLKNKSAENK